VQVSVEIPVEAEAVAMARDLVVGAVVEAAEAERRIDDLRLLTSEIVTNALRHAGLRSGDSISLVVEASRDRVRVEVADPGPGFDPDSLQEPKPGQVTGFGLWLVRKLADRWGVRRNHLTRVWFELLL
jgi:anti-sigma regulatory factor (Ser/Thr protein kinase)